LILSALIQTTGNELVGRWDADARSRGGLGAWMTPAADYTCMQTTAAMADGTWQLAGDRLVRKVPEGPHGDVQTEELTVAITDRR
jgi:hypothetical protein